MRRIKKGRHSGFAIWKKKDWLLQQYVGKGLSIAQMAAMAGVEVPTIAYWLKKHGIKTRSISEARLGSRHSEETKQKISNSQKQNKLKSVEH